MLALLTSLTTSKYVFDASVTSFSIASVTTFTYVLDASVSHISDNYHVRSGC